MFVAAAARWAARAEWTASRCHHAGAATDGAIPVDLGYAVCQGKNDPHTGRCLAHRDDIAPSLSSVVGGYPPYSLQDAYGIANSVMSAGSDQTVAVVVAYDAPKLEDDLKRYRAAFHLPACKKDKGCLQFVYPSGHRPHHDPSWSVEAALDVEMVSAICPRCKIMVVESQDDDLANLSGAVSAAVAKGATVVSNSYSVPETAETVGYAHYYMHPGVPITAAAGDDGYAASFPATLATVTAVGGTSLTHSSNGWTAAVWSGSGGGCSRFTAKPSWQTDTGCSNRTSNDLAVIGDPATGVAAYVEDAGGWGVYGGTSISAAIVAAMYALAENGRTIDDASRLYAHRSSFAPVTMGSDGVCSEKYLCSGGFGYNAPSGLGSPKGLSAF